MKLLIKYLKAITHIQLCFMDFTKPANPYPFATRILQKSKNATELAFYVLISPSFT